MFASPRDVPQHEASQSNENPNKCHICKNTFENEHDVRIHIIEMHKEKLFKCTTCNESFVLNSNLKEYELIHSSNDRPYPCDKCEKRYKTKKSLGAHIKFIHEKKHCICNTCHAKFPYRSKLEGHEVCHSKARPYECDICKKNFKDKNGVQQHIIHVHNEKLFKCDICHMSFANNYKLHKHKTLHLKRDHIRVINVTNVSK